MRWGVSDAGARYVVPPESSRGRQGSRPGSKDYGSLMVFWLAKCWSVTVREAKLHWHNNTMQPSVFSCVCVCVCVCHGWIAGEVLSRVSQAQRLLMPLLAYGCVLSELSFALSNIYSYKQREALALVGAHVSLMSLPLLLLLSPRLSLSLLSFLVLTNSQNISWLGRSSCSKLKGHATYFFSSLFFSRGIRSKRSGWVHLWKQCWVVSSLVV